MTEKTGKEESLGESGMSSKAGELPPAQSWRPTQRGVSGGTAGSSKVRMVKIRIRQKMRVLG